MNCHASTSIFCTFPSDSLFYALLGSHPTRPGHFSLHGIENQGQFDLRPRTFYVFAFVLSWSPLDTTLFARHGLQTRIHLLSSLLLSSTMSLKHSRKTPVPILLNEFPVPPSFIPQNVPQPQPSNPPPSRPPSLPLPPIPGPSPLSENDLFQISAAARSRRSSRISTSSTSSSWRGSVASIASASSGPSSLAAPTSAATTSQLPGRIRTESATSTSVHSVRSNTSLSVPTSSYAAARTANPDNHRPTSKPMAVNPAILEDDESLSVDAVEASLTLTSLSDIPRTSPSPHPHAGDEPTIHGERLSSIDMRDLPALHDDDTTDLDPQVHLHARASRLKSSMQKPRIRQAIPRPQPQPNGNLTGGKGHRRTSSAAQHPWNRESLHETSDAPKPYQSTSFPDESERASSPDVASFLAATPRQRRRSETSTGSKSQSRRRTHKSLPGSCRASVVGRLSIFSLPDQPAPLGSAPLTPRSLLAYAGNPDDELWNDDSLEDYGVVIGGGDGDFANVPDEDDATGDSDSSLDLHTPLPCVLFFANCPNCLPQN